MTELEEEVARSAIRHLMATYNNTGDRGRIAELGQVFASEGVLQVPGRELRGRAAIEAYLGGVARGETETLNLGGSRHHLTTSRIELLSAQEAQGWTYFFVMRRGTCIQEGLYVDRFARQPDGWRIMHRRVKLLWTLGE